MIQCTCQMHFDNEFERARLIPFAIDLNSNALSVALNISA